MSTINIKELKEIASYIIENNKKLRANNKKTTAFEIMGESGIGKTSVIMQLAEELNMDCVKLNLTQIEELGDLVGYPIKEYEISYGGQTKYISGDLLKYYTSLGNKVTGNLRMGYATPTWLPKTTNPNGGILILDDFNRADPRFIQATMELIDRGEYISWSLPEGWTICLTSNPDNGDYNVSSMDNAQKTRYISFELDFDKDVWARWAEEEKIDGRCINFVLSYPEILNKEGNVQTVNPRSLVTFFNTISGFDNFSEAHTLGLILNIAQGAFTSKENIIGNLFTQFIANKLDRLITPEDMLFQDWSSVKGRLKSCIYDGNNYRADIAAVLTTRLYNYVSIYFEQKGTSSDAVLERIIEIVQSETKLLTEDLIFNLLKGLVQKYPSRTNKLLLNPTIISKII